MILYFFFLPFFQVIRVEATDEDCSPHYGDICGYQIESQNQPFTISKEGKFILHTNRKCKKMAGQNTYPILILNHANSRKHVPQPLLNQEFR